MRIAPPIGRIRITAQERGEPRQFGHLQAPVEALSGPPIVGGSTGDAVSRAFRHEANFDQG
jgi:hypothetical protein